jgi:lysozyme family protein
MIFEQAVEKVLAHEGGYVDHPDDPAGATRWGITEAVARRVGYRGNMRDLPVDLAKRIYREDYWNAVRADELPAEIRYVVFDAAVNSGPRQSIQWLQQALAVPADGVLGPITMGKAHQADPEQLRRACLASRLRFMTNLTTWPSFGRGWARRICDLMEQA